MRRFQYVEPLHDHHDEPVYITVSDEWILSMYWPYWEQAMYRAARHPADITKEHCIEDFCVIHWAEEV